MKVVNVIKNGTLVQAGVSVSTVNTTRLIEVSNTITVCAQHIGGTITITLKWSPNGKDFITQAAAAAVGSDVSAVTTGVLAWDNFILPALAQAVEITVTENNAAPITNLDLDLLCT